MKDYQAKNIRNLTIVGHGSVGKTTLAEALLFTAGAIDRQGRVEDGQSTMDYDPEEINALKVGDAIWTEGREVEIRSITERDGYIVLNADTDDDVWLFESVDLNYWIMDVNDNTWLEFATVTVPASGHLLFLDGINPSTGESLLHPTVYNEEDFMTLMNSADDPGFDIRNVEVVFDENGELALIRRFYVPWQ